MLIAPFSSTLFSSTIADTITSRIPTVLSDIQQLRRPDYGWINAYQMMLQSNLSILSTALEFHEMARKQSDAQYLRFFRALSGGAVGLADVQRFTEELAEALESEKKVKGDNAVLRGVVDGFLAWDDGLGKNVSAIQVCTCISN
jgi:hypothetical protein